MAMVGVGEAHGLPPPIPSLDPAPRAQRAMSPNPRDPRTAMARHMSEEDLLKAITEAATFLGWRWHHIRRSDLSIQMGHSGFPDLILCKGKRIYGFELKSSRGQPTPDQLAWLEAMPNAYLIGPEDLDRVLSALKEEPLLSERELGL